MQSVRRCPRCGGLPKTYTEVWTGHYIEFGAKADGTPEAEGFMGEGHATHINAVCGKCEHTWRLRGVQWVSDLRPRPNTFNQSMRAAYKAVGVPLWVTPQEAADSLRYKGWSAQISLELGDWFARIWSMAFATGYKALKPFAPTRDHVLRMLSKMGYAPAPAQELAGLLLDNIEGMHRKGSQRRNLKP